MKSQIEVFLVFDTETVGLIQKGIIPAMIEIACCPFNQQLEDLKEYDSGVFQVYADKPISPQALAASGITFGQIENGRPSQQVADELVKYLKSLSKKPNKICLVGQNIDAFDIPILMDFLEIHGHDLSKLVNTDFTIDSMWWGRVKHPESINYKLGTLCENVNIDLANAHRAINDTRANKELVKQYIASLRGEGNSVNNNYKRPKFEWK